MQSLLTLVQRCVSKRIAAAFNVREGWDRFSLALQGSLASVRTATIIFRPTILSKMQFSSHDGPQMTVDSVKGSQVDCFWTGDDGEPNAEGFPADVLQKF
jgi:hypothetical protein